MAERAVAFGGTFSKDNTLEQQSVENNKFIQINDMGKIFANIFPISKNLRIFAIAFKQRTAAFV
ncbi:MAG: hypothetical protein IJT39_05785 [Bacteroidales bacterium]|nr:hypothetical protein [Bacteroidales bacterium]